MNEEEKRKPNTQTWVSQNFDRTIKGNERDAARISKDWRDGNYARAVGGFVGGSVKSAVNTVVDTTDAALSHSVFPIIRGGIEFGKGLFGIDDEPATTQQAAPTATQSNATANATTGGQLHQALREQQGLRQAGKMPVVQDKQPPMQQQTPVNTAKLGLNGSRFSRGEQPEPMASNHQGLGLNAAAYSSLSGSLNNNQGNFGLNINMPTMPNFNQQPERPFVATFGKTPDDNERRALLNAALTPHKGAKNGQLTANQLNAARGLLESEQRNAIDLQKAQEQLANQYQIAQNNNANALQRDWLQQTGGLNRDALNHFANLQREQLSQQGQNQRSALSGSLDMARTAENARQFDVKQAFDYRKNQVESAKAAREMALLQRMDGLRERLLTAKDDKEKSAIARELAILNGQDEPQVGGFNKDAFMKIQRNVLGADGLASTQDDVVDLRTGRSILDGAAGHVKVGQVVDGMRFKGGNPNDEQNWEQVK